MGGQVAARYMTLLRTIGLLLVVSNVLLQILDWATTFVGYQMGLREVNGPTLWLIGVIGDRYLAVSLEKVAYILVLIFILVLTNGLTRAAGSRRVNARYASLALLDVFLVSLAVVYVGTVAANIQALGH